MKERQHHLLAIGAPDEAALRDRANTIAALVVSGGSAALPDLCYTLFQSDAGFPHRLACVVAANDEACAGAAERLRRYAAGEEGDGLYRGDGAAAAPEVAFLFTGQGAQSPGMGAELFQTHPGFRATMEACEAALMDKLAEPLLSVIYPEGDSGLIHQTAYTQPALFALEYALAKLWQSWGAQPGLMLGHSVGEYAAACVAGGVSLEDGLTLIAERGRLIQALPPGGEMAAVFSDRTTVNAAIAPFADRVAIAAHNGPQLSVISGIAEPLGQALAALEAQGIRAKRMTVSHAFHSPQMDEILAPFHTFASGIAFKPLDLPIVSNKDGAVVEAGTVLGADYWRDHIRGAVAFQDGMETLAARGFRVFLEIGPSNTLIGMGRRCVDIEGAAWLPSFGKRDANWEGMLTAAAELWVRGVPLTLTAIDAPFDRSRIDVPSH